MVCNSVAMATEWENGRRLTIVPNVPEKAVVGIKIPPKMPITLIRIEDIGPVTFSFFEITPIKIPKVMYKIADGIR